MRKGSTEEVASLPAIGVVCEDHVAVATSEDSSR